MKLTKEECEKLLSILDERDYQGDHVVSSILGKIRRSVSVRKYYRTLR